MSESAYELLVLKERRQAPPPAVPEALPLHLRALRYLLQAIRRNPLAALVVGGPVLLATLYFGLIAPNVYVSEAHFIVRMKSDQGQGALGSISGASPLSSLSTMTASLDDTQAVNDYLASRDAMFRLVKEASFLEIVARPEADFLSRYPRFWWRKTLEALYELYPGFVYPDIDMSSGISTLLVYAFRPEDARNLSQTLLRYGEERVNQMNDRALEDSIAFAREMLASSEVKLKETQAVLTAFREREHVFDPKRQGTAEIELISKLSSEVAELKAELGEVVANSPGSPKIASIKARIDALERQIDDYHAALVGGKNALAGKLAEYEKLALDQELAAKSFAANAASVEDALKQSQQQRLYLQHVVEPNLPDYPLYPKRMLKILITLGFSLCVYWILSVLGSVILEHDPS